MQQTKSQINAEEHLGLVHLCANRFRNRGMEYEELYSAGCIGLVKAAKAFDMERGVCFSTYAVPVIMGEIRRLFRDSGTVKVSRRLKELSLRAGQVCERFRQEYGNEPTISVVAEALGVSEAEAAEALCAMQPVISLTACNDDGELQMDLPVPAHDTEIQEHMALQQVMELLSEEERMLINLRYTHMLTQTETAKRLGISQVQVSRKEKKLLLFMRQQLLQ